MSGMFPDPRFQNPQGYEDNAGEGYHRVYRRWRSTAWLSVLGALAIAGLLLLLLRY